MVLGLRKHELKFQNQSVNVHTYNTHMLADSYKMSQDHRQKSFLPYCW